MTVLVSTHPSRALKDIEDLLLSNGLVGGLRVGLGCWSEDGVYVGVNQGNQLGVDRSGSLTELPIDPILEDANHDRTGGQNTFLNSPITTQLVIILNHLVHIYLNGHFVLGEGTAPKQLVDTVNGEESCYVGT